MAVTVEVVEDEDGVRQFLEFHDRVYAYRSARWLEIVPLRMPLLLGRGPGSESRTVRPLVARENGEIVARVAPVIDSAYQERWGEALGHVGLFEALPDAAHATKVLMDAACEWLAGKGIVATRAGFGNSDFPFAIDDYESLPPVMVRQNPPYYHRFLKDSGFESEKGWVDYKIEVRPELVARWRDFLGAAKQRGFEIVPIKDAPEDKWVTQFTDTWNDAFHEHWAHTPQREDEFEGLFRTLEPLGAKDTSVIAYEGGDPVGVLWVAPELSATAAVAPGRVLRDEEKLNFLGIGVREHARGKGVNLAMAAYAYLELVRRGAKFLSYTLVLDDNWPSRRTAEKLGAFVCANYMVYRRNFR